MFDANFLSNYYGSIRKNGILPCALACSLPLNGAVRRSFVLAIIFGGGLTLGSSILHAEGLEQSTEKFVYHDASGRVSSVKIIRHYWTKPIVHPFAKIDPRLD